MRNKVAQKITHLIYNYKTKETQQQQGMNQDDATTILDVWKSLARLLLSMTGNGVDI